MRAEKCTNVFPVQFNRCSILSNPFIKSVKRKATTITKNNWIEVIKSNLLFTCPIWEFIATLHCSHNDADYVAMQAQTPSFIFHLLEFRTNIFFLNDDREVRRKTTLNLTIVRKKNSEKLWKLWVGCARKHTLEWSAVQLVSILKQFIYKRVI